MLASWHSFFTTEAEVAATLTGLLFVALSINLKEIIDGVGLPGRAGEALLVLLLPLFVGLAGALPQSSTLAFGLEVTVVALAAGAVVTSIVWRAYGTRGARVTSRMYLVRASSATVAVVPTIVAGAIVAAGHPSGLWVAAFGAGACIAAGVGDAWVLLVEILR